MNREICLETLVQHCLMIDEDRSVLNVPGLLLYPHAMHWVTDSFINIIVKNQILVPLDAIVTPDYGGTVFAISTQTLISSLFSVHIPVHRFSKKGRLDKDITLYHPQGVGIIIIDDVLTTGTAIQPILHLAEKKSIPVLGVFVVVNRSEGGGSNLLLEHNIPFTYLFEMTELLSLYNKRKNYE